MAGSSSDEIIEAVVVSPLAKGGKRRSWLGLVAIGVGIIAFVGLGAYVIITEKHKDATKVADMVRNHPIVIERLGHIEECKWNSAASLNEGGKRTQVFDVRGSRGSGQFVTFEFLHKFRSITLRTTEGEWDLLD